ncbi:fas-associated death domain protein isoform X2 [Anopheles funestus]|uniref:fas-associated death domain protein isoform X2 n=1 Tax=Anopheles funestus TaxID=62324 RepID=UPI0020C679F5|nr:fas-associated death domain protein isoform X2 [Anopheles funestus]
MERISVQDHRTVYEQMCKDYLNLKLLAQNACPDREHLERCKNSVREEVHSCRKLCRVTEFDHLVLLLEQRNLLSLLKPDLIERFELALDAKDVSCALKSYRNLRHRDRRTLLEKEVEKIKLHETNDTLMPSAVNTKRDKYLQQRDKVYSLLQLEIGKSWKPFGRFLNVPPAVLEEIEDRNRQDLKTRIYEVLHWAEKQFADDTLDQFFVVLLKALENTRRKDLKRKIESMLQE